VSSALELMRRIMQPRSRSMPHITVRYTSTLRQTEVVEALYSDYTVTDLVIAEPATFDQFGSTADSLRTLVLRCESESLEHLSYRPRYTDSFFHTTLYDDGGSHLAAMLFNELKTLKWNLHLPSPSRVTRYRPGLRPSLEHGAPLSKRAAELLGRLVGGASLSTVVSADNDEKLRILISLARVIQESDEVRPAKSSTPPPLRTPGSERRRTATQGVLWPDNELAGLNLSQLRASRERLATGTVLTPPEIAVEVTRLALELSPPNEPIDFGDPALGTGIFFAALNRLADAQRIRSAIGFEENVGRAHDTATRWRHTPLEVIPGDFFGLRDEAAPRNLIVANPPFLRYERQSRADIAEVERKLEAELNITVLPRSNLYIHFLLAAHRWMRPGAVAAWVLPSTFLRSSYASAVRQYLTDKVTLERVHSYSTEERVFDNARVAPSVVIFRNISPHRATTALISAGGFLDAPKRAVALPTEQLRNSPTWSALALFLPRPTNRQMSVSLDDLFEIRRGIATGGNGFFVLSEQQVQTLGAPRRWIRPLLPKSRFLQGSIVRADTDGLPLLERRLWLIDSGETPASVEMEAPEFAKYLRSIPVGVSEGVLVRRRSATYRQEQLKTPLFVLISMAREPKGAGNERFILNKSRAVALNSYHLLTPRQLVSEWLEAGRVTEETLLSALRSIREEELVRAGRRYSNGLLKLEPTDLRLVRLDLRGLGL